MIAISADEIAAARHDINRLVANIEQVIIGKRETVLLIIAALLARGHVLLEDRPGVGKTMLARALARSIAVDFKRIQCTPDLLPVDITGYVDPRKDTFVPGAVFANVVLADELNRAMPRTQSAMLEAMGEGQVTVDGHTHELPDPFMVIATQNPIEHAGVNDLPEAQLDRFHLLLTLGYPSEDEESAILLNRMGEDPLFAVEPVFGIARALELIGLASRVTIDERLVHYIVATVRHTRESPLLSMGASPRAALQVLHVARAFALVQGRAYVIPDDVKALFLRSLPHRCIPQTMPDGPMNMSDWKTRIIEQSVAEVTLPE